MWLTVIGWKPGLVYKIVDLSIRLKCDQNYDHVFKKKMIFFFECYSKDISASFQF